MATRPFPYSRLPGSGEDETVTRELGAEMAGRPQYPGTMVVLADDDEPTREASTLPDAAVEELAPEDVTLVADKSSANIDLRLLHRPLGALPPPSTPPPRELPRATLPPRRQGSVGPAPFGRPATLAPLRVVAPPSSSARWTVPEPSQHIPARRRHDAGASASSRFQPAEAPARPSALPRVLLGAPAPLPPLPPLPPPPLDLGEATDLLPAAPAPQPAASSIPPATASAPSMPLAYAPPPVATPAPMVAQPVPTPPPSVPVALPSHPTPFQRQPLPEHMTPGYVPEPQVAAPSYALPRTGPSRAAKLGAICGAASLVLSLGIGVLSLLPRHGTLRVELETNRRTAAEKAEVFIDGQKVCDVAPCIVSDLSPGLKTIRVIGPSIPGGSAVVTATVEAGRERLAMVPLGGEPVAAGPSGAGELHVPAGQPGVRMLVDGVDHGVLPLDMKDVPAGIHRLRFEGGERFAPLERQVDVAAGRAVDLGTIRLKLLKGRITVDDAPNGARVVLVRNTPPTSERVLSGPWPMSVDVDAVSWQIIASKKGQGEVTEEVSFEDGQSEKRVRLELTGDSNASAAAAPSAPVAVATRDPAPARTPSHAAAREAPAAPARTAEAPPRPAEPERPAAVSATGTGTLSMNSLPLSKVLIDGRPLGSTPKVDVPVPAGTHTVTFVHPDLGKKSVTVTVRAGESASASVRFRKD